MQGNSFRCIRRHVSTLITFGNECFMTCIGRPFWPFFSDDVVEKCFDKERNVICEQILMTNGLATFCYRHFFFHSFTLQQTHSL